MKGSGKIDAHYDWSLRLMSAKCYYFSGYKAGVDRQLKTADELAAYHSEYHYDYPGRQWEMRFPDFLSFSIDQFIPLRDQEVSKLNSDPNLALKANYTTIEGLSQEGLIANALQASNAKKAEVCRFFESPPLTAAQPDGLTQEKKNTRQCVG
jgi:hypothetical protein